MWVLRFELGSPCLYSRHFTSRAMSQSLRLILNWTRWCAPIILAFGRLRKEELEIQNTLSYTAKPYLTKLEILHYCKEVLLLTKCCIWKRLQLVTQHLGLQDYDYGMITFNAVCHKGKGQRDGCAVVYFL